MQRAGPGERLLLGPQRVRQRLQHRRRHRPAGAVRLVAAQRGQIQHVGAAHPARRAGHPGPWPRRRHPGPETQVHLVDAAPADAVGHPQARGRRRCGTGAGRSGRRSSARRIPPPASRRPVPGRGRACASGWRSTRRRRSGSAAPRRSARRPRRDRAGAHPGDPAPGGHHGHRSSSPPTYQSSVGRRALGWRRDPVRRSRCRPTEADYPQTGHDAGAGAGAGERATGRPDAAAQPGRGDRPAAPAGPGLAAAPAGGGRRPDVADPVRAARHRQDHAGQASSPPPATAGSSSCPRSTPGSRTSGR